MINQIASAALNNNSSVKKDAGNPVHAAKASQASTNTADQNAAFSPESSLGVVNDNVIKAIDNALAANNATPIRNLNASDFTPESVAKGILNFVQNAISRAQNRGLSASDLITQANTGIEDGFNQAKSILTSLNALSGQIAEGVQKTYDLIHAGMQQIEIAQKNGETIDFNSQNSTITEISQQSQSQTRTFTLDISTQDGDKVQISIFQSQSSQQFETTQSQGDINASRSQSLSRASSSFEFTVSGSFSNGEISAIEDMLAKTKAISEDFFNGDVSAGFEVGLNLGFNSKEIAGFALQLNDSRTQTASRAYREINRFGTESNRVSPSHLENLLKPAYEVMQGLRDNVNNAANSNLFKHSAQNPVEGLFNYFSRANPGNNAQIQRFESLTGTAFENMTAQLVSAVRQ